ncbi:protease adaptor protein RcdA [Maritalea sp.]|uniref:protease adaptor protein RcdA n=1 Tax=Maritalea sp. TaxID=2003361 RepID=UPI003EF7B14E
MTQSDQSNDAQSIGPRIVATGGFDTLYREGMKLVEDAAAYLDGEGRAASKILGRDASLLYASQSMQLTTRLMQLASWLLLQRAVREGELTELEAQSEDRRVELSTKMADTDVPMWSELPQRMRQMIEKADSLNKRIHALDAMERGGAAEQAEPQNPVNSHLARLRSAFDGPAES